MAAAAPKGRRRRGDVYGSAAIMTVLVYLLYIVVMGDDLVPFATDTGLDVEIDMDVVLERSGGDKDKIKVWNGSDVEEPQGWHIQKRREEFTVRFGANFAPERLENRPFDVPAFQDPGEDYLPFPEDAVEERWRNEPRMVYDVNLNRMVDDFGLIDDMYTLQDLEEIFTLVVEIYARANVYIRVPREDLANTHKLSRLRSLIYLAYVEGPDYGEYTNLRENKNSLNLPKHLVEYNEWYYKEWRKIMPLKAPIMERFTRSFRSLKKPFWVKQKSDFMRNLLDWIIGFPHMQTPWQIAHTTPMFPMYSVHIMNGECRAGRITGRTGSCWDRPLKTIVDKANGGVFIKNMTCRRYMHQLQQRYRMKKGETFVRETEKRTMFGKGAARMWAHEIGHSLGLHHPSNECFEAKRWQDNNLMMQQRYVGLAGAGCPDTPTEDQVEGTSWDEDQLIKIRKYIGNRDVRQSNTVPNGVTVGESTEQLGARTPPVFRRFLLNRANMIGNGKNIRRRPCGLPQAMVIFYALPSPIDGRVHRVRWLPTTWRSKPFRVRVFVVTALDKFEKSHTTQQFEVVQRSEFITVPVYKQKMHIEVDLPKPLLITKGQLIMITTEDGSPLNIDQQLYESDKVLYGDISGKLPQWGPSFHNEALRSKHSEVKLSYPALRINRRNRLWFFSSKNINKVNIFDVDDTETGAIQFTAHAPPPDDKDSWCLPLIFNFDVMGE